MSIKRPRYKEDLAQEAINISPLIDVLFILLIFFIVTMVFSNRSAIEVQSPKASNASVLEKESILISIDRDGLYYLEAQKFSLEELEFKLRALSASKKLSVMLEADANAPVQSIVSLIDVSKGLGIDEVYVITDKK